MSREILCGAATASLGVYITLSALETYSSLRHGTSLTPVPFLFNIWLSIPLLAPLFLLQRAYRYQAGMRRHHCRPARVFPHRDPILGTDLVRRITTAAREYRMLPLMASLFDEAGRGTFWAVQLGQWIVTTMDPENVKAIHATKFADWPIEGPRKHTIVNSIGPGSIFASNGQQWHDARGLIRPTFVRDQIADLACFDRHVSNFIAKMPRDGSTVDMQKYLYLMTMDSSTDFMFGHSSNTLNTPSEEAAEFIRAFEYSFEASARKARLGWVGPWVPDSKLKWAKATTRQFVINYIHRVQGMSKSDKERKYVFLDELLATGASIDDIVQSLLSMILGGRDTSAQTLAALFWFLARNPEKVRKLRAEVDELGGRQATWEELKNMRYVNMCIKETLRLYGPVSINSRFSGKDTVLPVGGGQDGRSPMFVPKGTICRWVPYAMHRREEFFGANPDEFRPERWETIKPSWEYIPFGGGPRICIGQQFALTQMCYFVTRMFQTFKAVEPRDDRPIEILNSATIRFVNGCLVSLTPIEN